MEETEIGKGRGGGQNNRKSSNEKSRSNEFYNWYF